MLSGLRILLFPKYIVSNTYSYTLLQAYPLFSSLLFLPTVCLIVEFILSLISLISPGQLEAYWERGSMLSSQTGIKFQPQ